LFVFVVVLMITLGRMARYGGMEEPDVKSAVQ
jgi:hypothetical protein